MLKLPITYINPFTEQEVTEEHFFHISKADLVAMELEEHGQTYVKDGEELTGMRAKLQRIMDAEDGKAILEELRDIIGRSYGKKDGDRFRKSPEIRDEFMSSEAYSELLFKICTSPDDAAKFVNGIVPHNLNEIAADVQRQAELARARGENKGTATDAPKESEAIAAVEEVAEQTGADFPTREKEIANATAAEPVTLTEAELRELDSDDLKSGLATGRYKLS